VAGDVITAFNGTQAKGVTINYDKSQGSGGGITNWLAGTYDFAGSDAALTADQETSAASICGSGVGASVAANKIRGVRAVDAWNVERAKQSRAHNDANVLCLGERLVPETEAIAIVDTWLATPFEGGRHARRVAQIAALELEENHSEDLRQPTATTDVQQQ